MCRLGCGITALNSTLTFTGNTILFSRIGHYIFEALGIGGGAILTVTSLTQFPPLQLTWPLERALSRFPTNSVPCENTLQSAWRVRRWNNFHDQSVQPTQVSEELPVYCTCQMPDSLNNMVECVSGFAIAVSWSYQEYKVRGKRWLNWQINSTMYIIVRPDLLDVLLLELA